MPACAGRDQRAMIGGCPCVVHGLRAAQPGEGDAFTSPQPGKRWATGGQPRCDGECAVAPAGAAELRCSGRWDTTRQARDESPLRGRRDRVIAATSSRSHRRHVACMPLRSSVAQSGPCRGVRAARTVHWTVQSRRLSPLVATARRSASNAPAASGLSCPSALSHSLRSNTLGILPRDCVPPLRACTKPCPAGAQPVRWCRTPCAPAAASIRRCPRPRIARQCLAPHHVRHARSRGFGPSVDITRDYAQAACLCGAARGVLPRSQRRARVIRRYVTAVPHIRVLAKVPRSRRGVVTASCTRYARLRAIHGLRRTRMCKCRGRRTRRSDPLADSVSRLRASAVRGSGGSAVARSNAKSGHQEEARSQPPKPPRGR